MAQFEYERQNGRLFDVGKQFPPEEDIERLARYERGKKLFEGKHYEVFHRAAQLYESGGLEGKIREQQLETLYIACNLIDLIVTKPADMMFQEEPEYTTGKVDTERQTKAINEIVRRNRLNLLGHEIVTSAGFRGDAFIKVYFDYMVDYSELGFIPEGAKMEPIIEAQDPSTVFPELARGSKKRFKAINIAYVEWVDEGDTETPYLNVERHLAGLIEYSRFRLRSNGVEGYNDKYGVGIPTFTIEERVPTGRENDIVYTGVNEMLIYHIPYKTVDDDWKGISTAQNVESLIAAINDRLVQIDYILLKHSDPTAYGPDLDTAELKWGGKYIPVAKDEVPPSYMTWDSKMDGAFRELEMLIGMVFQIAETPQWLFGTVITGNAGGTGTSHTDAKAIQARFMPILTKVKRIRTHVDKAFRDALYAAQVLENKGNEDVDDFEPYEPVYPKINWKDGLPKDEKEVAEIMSIRTGGKPTLDVVSAIQRLDNVDEEKAAEILDRIRKDEEAEAFVDGSIFNDLSEEEGEADGEAGDS